ncbi:MAG: Ig-like domain-containing protein [Erysipelotrichaceae bacterium]|nr:Ig-like domain-containing protein [Erysipelotrichaceae bacterium]
MKKENINMFLKICCICFIGFMTVYFMKSLFVTVDDSKINNIEIYIGQTYQADSQLEYHCNQNNLVSVDNNGLFTGLSAGKATVKANIKRSLLYKTFEIVIKEHPYVIDSSPQQLQVNSTLTLSATDIITNENVTDVQWLSSDENIATIDENGIVVGIKSGNVKISLKHNNVIDSVKNIEVLDEVIKVSNITITSGYNITLNPGQTSQIVYDLYPINATDTTLNYSIEDGSIATIDEDGLITAKNVGSTTMTIISNDQNATTQINLTTQEQPTQGNELTFEKLQKAGIDESTKLMIVAHPDDETLWGGGHLTEGNWFVVCITNGDNQTRNNEFYKAIEALGANGIIMCYPDKVNGERSNWTSDKEDITADLDFVIRYKEWDQITTHNKDDEYGHIHHKMTNAIVTSISRQAGKLDKLYYFGKYYSKNNIPSSLKENINTDAIKKKEIVYDIYTSQAKVIKKMNQMTAHEHWTKAIN